MSRLIIISNRLPFSVENTEGEVKLRQSSGGLVSALKSYFEKNSQGSKSFTEKVWVGSADFSSGDWEQTKSGMQAVDFKIEPLFIEEDTYNNYYNGFSNSTIWPLFHYFPSITSFIKEHYSAYYKVNQLFAEKIASIMQPGDVVWIHDYQLMVLPQLLRKIRPEATIGFFLHIPFPSYEIFRLIPRQWKQDILEGILGADLVGFHTIDYAQHFIQSVKMLLGVDNQYNLIQFKDRLVKVDLFPIGIDYNKFKEAVETKEVLAYHDELKNNFSDKKIIFSVDRLDYTKGLNYRLEGYENFLERYPEWREKVIFILNIIPSRNVIPAYMDRKKLIEEKVSTINGRFSTIQWQPLIYRFNHLPFNELCALYKVADVGLITPLRDGMNLVAKEFVASCNDGGVLILSELAGAATELSEAILVNPTDTEEMANAINAAMSMPLDEQTNRMKLMQTRLADYDVERWVNDFLDQLKSVKKEQEKMKVKLLDKKVSDTIINDYAGATRRCILLDYDGTLAPFTKIPSQAVPGNDLIDYLKKLSSDRKNEVVIISGRDAKTLEKWLGHLDVNFVAEHGVYIKYKGKDWQTQTSVSPDWKDKIRPILQTYVTRCAGSLMEEKENTLTWHYRNTHPTLGFTRSRELLNNLLQLTANTPVQVIDGNKVLEVRLTGVDKGMTAMKIMDHYQPDFALCIGDDTTDEDMFKALESRAYTIKIGSGSTTAAYNILSQVDVLPFLQKLLSPQLQTERV
jgi:trehalose 6-phosphate synthase/phosphatase